MEVVIGWLVLSVGVGLLADSRGRSGFGFFLLSFVLSPLIGLIAVLVTKNLKQVAQDAAQAAFDRQREHERQVASINAIAKSVAPPVAAPASAAPPVSVADELEKLASLRDRGVLTDEEFQHQKRAALAKASN
ncbi:SHOCT domain-containing protein [Rhizobacter sp. SG703]|uniref:SHOCT domain-containing protein n=1 Tax=Rhizobacter sp. SG703 TaxID=2587140 RepID=UPI001843500D|nr:SHOCT domain-containing protein [Rhizobacter sp. SG703]NKI96644.1 hemolysin activation/secretion protein [Rhizobacter sp. SG703]